MNPLMVWLAIAASLVMGCAGACLFVYAVKKGYFHDLEEAKFQMFWADVEDIVENSRSQETNERGPQRN